MLSADLIQRLRARAGDPATRNDDPAAQAPETSFFGGAFKTVRMTLGGSPPPAPRPLPAPASEAAIAAAEAALGFALPAELAQLYSAVADGGFGPGDGLAPLAAVAERYGALMAEPPGEGGQAWPEQLLPIGLTEPGADCYDMQTGAMVFWDEEVLADGPGDDVWESAFRSEADSLAAWLESWLGKAPLAQQQSQQMEKALLDGLRQTLARWRAMTPEERAEFGLPAEGWEEVLFGHLGVDLKSL